MGVMIDVGADNITRLEGVDDPRFNPQIENLVVLRTSAADYHFVVKDNGIWYSKPGGGSLVTMSESEVTAKEWNAPFPFPAYDSDIIYFSIKKNWSVK